MSIKIASTNCCDEVIDLPDFDDQNENAPQNFGIYHCPVCDHDCDVTIDYI